MFSKAHAVFFHRLFGPIKPQTFEILEIIDVIIVCERLTPLLVRRQPAVSDRETEQLIEEKVETFWKGLEGDFSKRGRASESILLDLPNY